MNCVAMTRRHAWSAGKISVAVEVVVDPASVSVMAEVVVDMIV